MSVIRFFGAAAAAAVTSMVGAVFVAGMGLVVPMHAVWPVTLGVAALLAALAASWVGNVLTADRARLLAVSAATGVAALILSVLLMLAAFSPDPVMAVLALPLIYVVGGCVAVLAGVAGAASLRLRNERGRLGWDGAAALLLSGAVLVAWTLMEGAGLIPGVPETGLAYGVYRRTVETGLIPVAIGALLAVLRSRRVSPGRELGGDAWLTLALVAAIPPAVSGAFSVLCSTLVMCSG